MSRIKTGESLLSAERALAHFPIAPRSIQHLQHGGSMTFAVEDCSGLRWALKLHAPLSDAVDPVWIRADTVHSQMIWLDHLSRHPGLGTPQPARTKDGMWTAALNLGSRPVTCTLLRWIEGECREEALSDPDLKLAAKVAAGLHGEADRWAPSSGINLPSYDSDRLRTALNAAENLVRSGNLQAAQFEILAASVDRILPLLNAEQRTRRWGVIHGDFNPANLVFHAEGGSAIDFAESGYGSCLQDIAQFVMHISPGRRRMFLSSYSEFRPMDVEAPLIIEALIIAQFVHWLAWISGIPERFSKATKFSNWIAQEHCRPFLAGKPFLHGKA